jgi:hypothetical protein
MEERKALRDRRKQFMSDFELLSRDQKEKMLVIALKHLLQALGDKPVEDMEETNPEEVTHSDQERIDAAFNELMKGIEL